MEIKVFSDGHTTVYAAEIDRRESSCALREAERHAVADVVRHVFGRNAEIEHRADGSPVVSGGEAQCEISVSHGAGLAVVAVGGKERIGVDVECWREQLRRVSSRFLSADEISAWGREELLLRAWTIKEAVYKAAGIKGLALTDIHLSESSSGAVATVFGRRYRLSYFGEFPIAITLAVPEK